MPIMFTEQEAKKIHTFTLQLCVRPYHDSAQGTLERNTLHHSLELFVCTCSFI